MDKKLSYAFPPPLMRAAEMFHKHGTTLYAVGGVVRDALLGLRVNDIDVASAMRPDDVCRLCDSSGLTVIPKGLRYGTVEMVLRVNHSIIARAETQSDGNCQNDDQ